MSIWIRLVALWGAMPAVAVLAVVGHERFCLVGKARGRSCCDGKEIKMQIERLSEWMDCASTVPGLQRRRRRSKPASAHGSGCERRREKSCSWRVKNDNEKSS